MRGYVYALVNSSLPDLVKVGKTTRLPSERVQELSRATGVPTPFVVAFEQPFANCDAAEREVHRELERRGLRQSANREFFRASAAEVTRIILAVHDAADEGPDQGEASDGTILEPFDEAEEVLAEAYRYFAGDGRLKDMARAAKLLERAARLGSSQACYDLGFLYQNGIGVTEDEDKALQFFTEAAERGDARAYPYMGRIYLMKASAAMAEIDVAALLKGNKATADRSRVFRENVSRCAELFVDASENGISDQDYDQGLRYLLDTQLIEGGVTGLPTKVQGALRERAATLLRLIHTEMDQLRASDPELAARSAARLKDSVRWLKKAAEGAERL